MPCLALRLYHCLQDLTDFRPWVVCSTTAGINTGRDGTRRTRSFFTIITALTGGTNWKLKFFLYLWFLRRNRSCLHLFHSVSSSLISLLEASDCWQFGNIVPWYLSFLNRNPKYSFLFLQVLIHPGPQAPTVMSTHLTSPFSYPVCSNISFVRYST